MNDSIYRITLDVLRPDAQLQLTARRADTARVIRANLTEGGRPYVLAADCQAELAAQLPDGRVLKNPCQIEDNTLVYTLTRATTAQVGVLECELRVLGAAGELLVSPRFTLVVYGTVYDAGDAALQELAAMDTVKSSAGGYSQVFLWSDGNPEGENRLCRFVAADDGRNAGMIRLAEGPEEILGVSAASPGFAALAGRERFREGVLALSYSYVTLLGFAPVTDRGRCQVNGLCTADADGTAVPCSTGGLLVAERLDEQTVTVLVLPGEGIRWGLLQGQQSLEEKQQGLEEKQASQKAKQQNLESKQQSLESRLQSLEEKQLTQAEYAALKARLEAGA